MSRYVRALKRICEPSESVVNPRTCRGARRAVLFLPGAELIVAASAPPQNRSIL